MPQVRYNSNSNTYMYDVDVYCTMYKEKTFKVRVRECIIGLIYI